jgi:hypothetical protein
MHPVIFVMLSQVCVICKIFSKHPYITNDTLGQSLMGCYFMLRSAGLRDLILRNTNMTNDELPQDIWTAVGSGGSCAAPGAGSSSGPGSQQRLATPVLNGQGNLEVRECIIIDVLQIEKHHACMSLGVASVALNSFVVSWRLALA